jgi:dynein heavy chain, axonemal
MLMAFHLEKRWKKLFSSAVYRSKTLHSTKVKFSQMTASDIEKFKHEVSLYRLKIAQQHFIHKFGENRW